jgi:beta-glucosidase
MQQMIIFVQILFTSDKTRTNDSFFDHNRGAILKYFALIHLFVLAFSTPVFADQAVETTLKNLTLKQKIGQITQPDVRWISPEEVRDNNIGTVLRGGGTLSGKEDDVSLENNQALDWAKMVETYKQAAIQSETKIPLIFAVDAVHGHSNVTGATLFPHNIGLGATHNSHLLRQIGKSTAWEVFVTGIDWNFSPTVAVSRNERWGRTYESFSEKTDVVTQLSTAYIEGLQSDLIPGYSIIGTAKHWIGDGGTMNGVDQGDTQISLSELKKIHLPPYQSAIKAGVKTIMVSFNSWNGKKLHGHRYLIQDLLKNSLQFKGVVVTDWNGIDQIETSPGLTDDEKYMHQIAQAFDAGIDVFMVPENWKKFISFTEQLVHNFENNVTPSINPARLDDAVRRVLKLKRDSKIATKPLPLDLYAKYSEKFGSIKHRELAKKAAKASAVLLKSDSQKIISNGDSVLVMGELAKNTGYQAGGWSLAWQGVKRNIPGSLSIWDGVVKKQEKLYFNLDYSVDGNTLFKPNKIILVVGEDPYAEGQGDRTAQGATLSEEHNLLLKKALTYKVPVTVILISGRPLLFTKELDQASSIISYWLPGTMGSGIADLFTGEDAFSGRLSFSWPANENQIDFDYRTKNIVWKFPLGFGLR